MPRIEVSLFRHGHTPRNADPSIVTGQSLDVPLSELGERQAVTLGNYQAQNGLFPNVVNSSHALRTRMTAQLALESVGYAIMPPIGIDERLVEQNLGKSEGRPRTEVYTDDVKIQIALHGANYRHPGGESMADTGVRMYDWLTQTSEDLEGTEWLDAVQIHAYSHQIAIASLIARVEGVESPLEMRDHVLSLSQNNAIGNASHTFIVIENGTPNIEFIGQSTDI
jgi:broad specificity phosphatase PhoE